MLMSGEQVSREGERARERPKGKKGVWGVRESEQDAGDPSMQANEMWNLRVRNRDVQLRFV